MKGKLIVASKKWQQEILGVMCGKHLITKTFLRIYKTNRTNSTYLDNFNIFGYRIKINLSFFVCKKNLRVQYGNGSKDVVYYENKLLFSRDVEVG